LAQACFLTPPDQDVSVWPPKILNAGQKLSPDALKAKIDQEAFKLKTCFWLVIVMIHDHEMFLILILS
jgi:hypothetical protein